MELNVKKEIISRITSIITTSLFLIVTTWFWFGPRIELTEAQSQRQSKVMQYNNLEFVDLSEGIKLENAYPVTDTKGSSMEPYQFQVTNHDKKEVTFTISFVDDLLAIKEDQCNTLENNYIRYTIQKNNTTKTPTRNLAIDGSMYVDTLPAGETATYALNFWIDQNAGNEIMNTHFHGKVALILENN